MVDFDASSEVHLDSFSRDSRLVSEFHRRLHPFKRVRNFAAAAAIFM
jgi:hypothetical protein